MIVTTGATSKRIDRLEAQQLVTRRKASFDGRSRIVALTYRGRTTVDRLMPIQLDNQANILSVLSIEDAAKLAELLGHLLASLEATS
jgi:DNA-binding MarR family transcriptional regulator